MPSVLVTGASRGLGFEYVRQYLQDGWRVIATVRQPEYASALTALGVEVHRLDVARPSDAAVLAEGPLRGQAIDLLLNNAGMWGGDQDFGKLEPGSWEDAFRTNVIGPIKVAEAFLPNILAGQRKIMAFMSSRMGSVGANGQGGPTTTGRPRQPSTPP